MRFYLIFCLAILWGVWPAAGARAALIAADTEGDSGILDTAAVDAAEIQRTARLVSEPDDKAKSSDAASRLLPPEWTPTIRNLSAASGSVTSIADLLSVASSHSDSAAARTGQSRGNPWDVPSRTVKIGALAKSIVQMKKLERGIRYNERHRNTSTGDEKAGISIVTNVLNIDIDEDFVIAAANVIPTGVDLTGLANEGVQQLRDVGRVLNRIELALFTPAPDAADRAIPAINPVRLDTGPVGGPGASARRQTLPGPQGAPVQATTIKEEVMSIATHPLTILTGVLLLAGWIFFWIKSRTA